MAAILYPCQLSSTATLEKKTALTAFRSSRLLAISLSFSSLLIVAKLAAEAPAAEVGRGGETTTAGEGAEDVSSSSQPCETATGAGAGAGATEAAGRVCAGFVEGWEDECDREVGAGLAGGEVGVRPFVDAEA